MKKLIFFFATCVFTISENHAIFSSIHVYKLSHVVRDGDFYFWMQNHPTTKHGICAEVEGPDGGDIDSKDTRHLWAVDVPEPRPNRQGMSTNPTPQYTFNDGAEAKAWAEHLCPTGAAK